MYQLRGRLGRWGLGELYEALDTESNRVRMLKLIRGRRAQDTHIRHHMRHEYEAACTVLHPGIVKIHALEEEPNLGLYHVMDVVRGDTLSATQKRGLTFLPARALELVGTAASAISALEEHDVGHFELSPDSLFLPNAAGGKAPIPLIINFGLPPNEDQVPPLPLEALAYAAPERRASSKWDHRADVYSTCAILMQLLLGRTPPPQGWVRPPALPDDSDPLAKDLYEIAQRGLNSTPAQRYPSMKALYGALDFLANSVSVTLPAPSSPSSAGKPARPQPAYKETRTVLGMGTQGLADQTKTETSDGSLEDAAPQATASSNRPPPLPEQSQPKTVAGTAAQLRPAKRADKKTILGIGAIPALTVQDDQEAKQAQSPKPSRNRADQPLEPLAFPGGETGAQLALEPSEVNELALPPFSKRASNRKWVWIGTGIILLAALVAAAFVWMRHRAPTKNGAATSPQIAANATGAGGAATSEPDGSVPVKPNAQTPKRAARPDGGPAPTKKVDAAVAPTQESDASAQKTGAQTFKEILKKGRRALRHHRYQEAKAIFLKAAKVYKGSSTIKRLVGDTYYRMHNYWKAKWWYGSALKRSPRSASLHIKMAKTYSHLGRNRDACRHFVKALHLRPNSRRYRMNVENYRCR
ncbi:MAG: hypothetical protein J7M25_12715 [Deltaproteobacteria bacterium]|nr:hypothetical protein [Deltaproteobacteria bacterium]